MSLTQDDLQAIRDIVEEITEDSDRRTAAGFAEVHEKFAEVDEKFTEVQDKMAHGFTNLQTDLNRIENKLNPTIEQIDDHEVRLLALEPKAA